MSKRVGLRTMGGIGGKALVFTERKAGLAPWTGASAMGSVGTTYQNDFNQKILLPKPSGNVISKIGILWSGHVVGNPGGLGTWCIGISLTRGGAFLASTVFNPNTKTVSVWEYFELSPKITVNQAYLYVRIYYSPPGASGGFDAMDVWSSDTYVDTDENGWMFDSSIMNWSALFYIICSCFAA